MNCVKVEIANKRTIFTNEKIPVRELDSDVIVKVAYAGICGTDWHIIHGEFYAKDDIILGHEISGIIADISNNYDHLAIGDKVAVNPNMSCGICIPCKRKRTNFCVKGGLQHTIGIVSNGGWAEYVKVHVSLLTKVSDKVTLQQAVFCEPLSCVLHGLDKLDDLDIGSSILIVGAGIIGLLWSCLLHVLGHRNVIILEPNSKRRDVLSEIDLGFKCITWDEFTKYRKKNPTYKADICIDCSGNSEAMQVSLPLVQNGGTFLIFGVANPEKTLTVNPYQLFYNEITVRGVNINTPNSFERAMSCLESMSERYLQVEKLCIETFQLNEHQEALEAFQRGSFTKIIFKI